MQKETSSYITEIKRGLLSLAVLRALYANRLYASEIIKTLGSGRFATQEGTLYPLLSKLKREGLVIHEWVESPSGPPRKYYSLSDGGKRLVGDMLAELGSIYDELMIEKRRNV
jgi:PadR family transcriptional regulator, regulatory protein PadR